MRQIMKTLSLSIDGKPYTFRLKKMDALSGVCLLRLLAARSDSCAGAGSCTRSSSSTVSCTGAGADVDKGAHSDTGSAPNLATLLFSAASEEDLRRLLIRCLENVEVLLDAGYQPVMQMGEWSWTYLEYDTISAFTLAIREIAWSLDGFFVESGSTSPPGQPGS